MDDVKICCPKCNWEPDGFPYWQCTCGHRWNTFSTGGRCPACKRVWKETQCIDIAGGCSRWSLHLDWYKGLDEIVQGLREEISEARTVPV